MSQANVHQGPAIASPGHTGAVHLKVLPDERTQRLSDLRAGQSGWVTNFDTCPDCEVLRAMGFSEDRPVRMCRGGRTCILQVDATRFGISRDIAHRILVSIDDPSTAPTQQD